MYIQNAYSEAPTINCTLDCNESSSSSGSNLSLSDVSWPSVQELKFSKAGRSVYDIPEINKYQNHFTRQHSRRKIIFENVEENFFESNIILVIEKSLKDKEKRR